MWGHSVYSEFVIDNGNGKQNTNNVNKDKDFPFPLIRINTLTLNLFSMYGYSYVPHNSMGYIIFQCIYVYESSVSVQKRYLIESK